MNKRPQAVILLYHRVFDASTDPQLLCVRISHFAEHLAHLKQHCQPISLRALIAFLQDGHLPERAVVVTFDDGYADNLWNAKPLLERYGIPATIHVTTGLLGQQAEFWWDELERLVFFSHSFPEMLRIHMDGKQRVWKTPTRDVLYRDFHRSLRSLPAEMQDAALMELRRQLREPPTPRPTHRVLTPDELRTLAVGELLDIGAHSVSHSMLTSLPIERQHHEMAESKRQLEALLGCPVASFAYPYGGRAMVSRQTIAVAKDCGFESACSTIAEPVRLKSNPFFLPRFLVRDWSGEEFARQLQEFLG